MKKISVFSLLALVTIPSFSQILSSDPAFPTATDNITIYYNVASGNAEIPVNTLPIYAHTGVVTQEDVDNCQNNWQYVQGNWGTADPSVVMTPQGAGVHRIIINPSIFYDAPMGTDIARLMFVFRNQSGSLVGRNSNGSDIYLDLYDDGFNAGILQPSLQILATEAGEVIPILTGSSDPAELSIMVNDLVVASASNATELNYDFSSLVSGGYNIVFSAFDGMETITESILINIDPQPVVLTAPAGTMDGINYIDNTTVRLQIYAPNKDFIYVLGDFNNWQFNADYLMNRTPDGDTYWLDIADLDPNTSYRFQYSIDAGDMRVADVYTELVLDKWNDPYIPQSTFPDLQEYPSCSTSEIISVFKINQPEFVWTDQSFVRPPQERLVIYELLVRDFTEARNYQTLIDTLDYIENLGITAIELMPINEFEGNDSWGYNPSFYFAADKAYGTPESLKAFVNACHERGIAVILDIALNHSFGQNPMVRMYFDPALGLYGQPTAENPWFNQVDMHPFGVGYDFNHESPRVKQFCKRVIDYWLEEYHIDGYRFDLSKGFTQNNTLGNVGAWNQLDNSRIAILTEYYNHMLATEPGAYLILEHLSDNNEEVILANTGMMLWGNMSHQYQQASMGYSTESDLNWGSYVTRGWSGPKLVSYGESHDEERLQYKNENFGNGNGDYQITDLNTGLDRQELAHTFLIPVPGPKMIWQFGELGYDYSVNYCSFDGTIDEECRTYAKPVRWDYRDVTERYKLYKVVSALNSLKKTESLFSTTNFAVDMAGLGKRIHLNSGDMNATIVGNFNVVPINMIPGFQHTGTWYDYFTGNEMNVTDQSASHSFQPGEYHLYFDQPLATPDTGTVDVKEAMNLFKLNFMVYPNPAIDQFTIGFNNLVAGKVSIQLLDIAGSVVATIDERVMGSGLQTINWNAEVFARGMYFIRITNEKRVITNPLILGSN